MVEDKLYECGECGKKYGSKETLQEHSRLVHGHPTVLTGSSGFDLSGLKKFSSYINLSFGLGLVFGMMIMLGGVLAYSTFYTPPAHQIDVTVVTCDNCSYGKFRNATDELFNADYKEVDYKSKKGQSLIDKYNIKYVPAFIFDKKSLEEADNFTLVRPGLAEFKDAYVIPDEGVKKAQMLSHGFQLPE